MANVLVYATGRQGSQELLALDKAIDECRSNNIVYFLHCDSSIAICNDNITGDKRTCRTCCFFQRIYRKRYLPPNIHILSVKDFITPDIIKQSNTSFHYNNSEEYRNITFHGVEIGTGAMSTYIYKTRNMNPLISVKSKPYFDKLLAMQVKLTLVIERIYLEKKIDKFIFHNGRFAQYKPFLNFCEINNISYICTESARDNNGNIYRDDYINCVPHCLEMVAVKILDCWNNSTLSNKEKERIGKSFFERKRDSQETGDSVYTILQKKGEILDDWNQSKENIVIFNSSEDEFCSISKEFDKKKFFPSQLDGIITIMEKYKNDDNKHFYLRIHPNLSKIKYKYHTKLLELDYPNLTVIPGDSVIDSYTLVDCSSKVIVFGSTIGIEAVYAHKAVINLGPSTYDCLDVAYKPDSLSELFNYIEDRQLPTKYNDNVLKFGFYIMSYFNGLHHNDKCKNISGNCISYKIFSKEIKQLSHEKILGSHILQYAIWVLNKGLCRYFPPKTIIPLDEE